MHTIPQIPDFLSEYLKSGISNIIYETSKNTFYKGTEIITTACDSAAQMPEYLLNSAAKYVEQDLNLDYYNSTIKPFLVENNPFEYINTIATKLIAPNAHQKASPDSPPFQAFDLIAPALLILCSSKKVSQNALAAASKIKDLADGKRSVVTLFKLPSGCKGDECLFEMNHEQKVPTKNLLTGIILDLTFCAGWLALSQCAAQGTYTAIEAAENAHAATNVIRAVQICGFAQPVIWSLAKYLRNKLNTPASVANLVEPKPKLSAEPAKKLISKGPSFELAKND